RFSRVGIEPASRDDPPLKDLPKLHRRDGTLALGHDHVPLHPRLDDVQVRETEPIELLGDIPEEGLWAAIAHAVECPARAEPDSDTVTSPHRRNRLNHLKEQPGPVRNGATVFVGPMVAPVLKELVEKV